MTNLELFRSKSIDELAEWLNEHCQYDDTPWAWWFDENYCKKCEPITCKIEATNIGLEPLYPEQKVDCAYCELENKCRFCPDAAGIPDMKMMIKMWLSQEVLDEKN